MTSNLSTFAAHVRGLIASSTHVSGRPRADEFEGVALELFRLQFEHNAAYRSLCRALGKGPESVGGWSEIPPVPASAFKELDLTCLPPGERTSVFHSSGTTEHRPSRAFHNAESLGIYEASLLAGFGSTMLESPGERLSCLLLPPPPLEAPHSSLVHMLECVRRQHGTADSAFFGRSIGDAGWSIELDRLIPRLSASEVQSEPVALLGTAFNFVQLLDALGKRGLAFVLPRGSRVMETGGYKGRSRMLDKSELHQLIAERLGTPPCRIVSEYGMSELSSQAYDHSVVRARSTDSASRLFRFPTWARFLVVSPETGRPVSDGEPGLLRVFDLANVASVLAVQTEDLVVAHGDGFELLGRARLAERRGCSLMSA